jgi:hypothetical protein
MDCHKPDQGQNTMSHFPDVRDLKTTILVLIVSVTLIGCSKKEEKPSAAASSDTNISLVTATLAPRADDVSTDIKQSLAEVDTSLNANDYAKAVQTLLVVQNQRQLTDQQAQEVRTKMTGVQRILASAIAAGNPNAKAAGELLRSSAMHEK